MADGGGPISRVLARRRVPLGFVVAVIALLLSRPTWLSWSVGLAIALAGECLRIWASGHLEKGREVTRSGPYRVLGHPLYVGSVVMAGGVVLASRTFIVAIAVAVYMGVTIAAAIYTEETALRKKFGSTYDDYQASRAAPMPRRFSLERAMRNREHRAVAGLLIGFALLALKVRS